jgi:hypothetical protein
MPPEFSSETHERLNVDLVPTLERLSLLLRDETHDSFR